jgi:hypothetical protein
VIAREPMLHGRRWIGRRKHMSKMYFVLGGWMALNFALSMALLSRRPRPHLRNRMFLWVIGLAHSRRPNHHGAAAAHRRWLQEHGLQEHGQKGPMRFAGRRTGPIPLLQSRPCNRHAQ